jgi:hypothetical protein
MEKEKRSHHYLIDSILNIYMCEMTRSKRRKQSFITYLYIEYLWIDRYGIQKGRECIVCTSLSIVVVYHSFPFTLSCIVRILYCLYSLTYLFAIHPSGYMTTDEDNDQQAKKHLFVMMIEITRFCSHTHTLSSHIYVCMWIRSYDYIVTWIWTERKTL